MLEAASAVMKFPDDHKKFVECVKSISQMICRGHQAKENEKQELFFTMKTF